MKNLFIKGFASLALASVMTSNMFAAVNGTMIDVKKEFGTDGLSKTMVLAGTEGENANAFDRLTVVVGKIVIASAQVAETNNTAYNGFSKSIIIDELGQKFESISLGSAGAKSIGGDMKFGDNRLNTSLAFQRTDLTIGDNMKPGHNMLNIPLAFIDVKSLGGQTGTLNLKQRINMNNDNMIAFKRTDLTKSGIHNPVIKHLSLANVGYSKKSLFGNTLNIMNKYAFSSIIPSSKHTSDNLAFPVISGNNIFTSSLGKNNMKNTSLVPIYVLGSKTAGISCASPVNKVNNSNPHSSNCISNNLAIKDITLNPTGDSGAQLAIGNSGANNFAILKAV